jgi:large subunit ribosomal protein L25
MKLSVKKRSAAQKSTAKALRREGNIPAVLYSKGQEGTSIAVDGRDFDAARRQITKGHLPTTVFTLTDEDGSERKAIVKAIDYHPTSYRILHLDLMELHDDVLVNVKVPITPTGVMECAGIKLGGVLRQVIRHMPVRCLPKDIPTDFKLDVKSLLLKQSKRLKDLVMPETVAPLADLNEVAVVIAKR